MKKAQYIYAMNGDYRAISELGDPDNPARTRLLYFDVTEREKITIALRSYPKAQIHVSKKGHLEVFSYDFEIDQILNEVREIFPTSDGSPLKLELSKVNTYSSKATIDELEREIQNLYSQLYYAVFPPEIPGLLRSLAFEHGGYSSEEMQQMIAKSRSP